MKMRNHVNGCASRSMWTLSCLSLIVASLSTPASGATFCAHNSAELTTALATASTNGEDDSIKLAPGVFTPDSSGFQFHSSDLHGLSMGGGFDTPLGGVPCSLPLAGAQWSVVDGAGSNLLLDIVVTGASAAPLFLHDLTLRNGNSMSNHAVVNVGGLSDWNGDVVIENISIRENHATFIVASIVANGIIAVRSSAFVGNTSTGLSGMVLAVNSYSPGSGVSVFFNNNTVAGNSVPSSSYRAGLTLGGNAAAEVRVANSILWNNGGDDLYVFGAATAYLDHDDIGSRTVGADVLVNDIVPYQVDPLFVSANDAHLKSASPLRDAGVTPPIGGSGNNDLGGGARVVFGGTDLGAHEIQDAIFKDGFE